MKKQLRRFSEKEISKRGKLLIKKIKEEEKRVRHFHDVTKK